MAGPIDWNHGLMLLLLTATCAPLTSSDSSACPSEILEDTTVDIKPAITNGAIGMDPVHVSTEAKCLEKCCLANTASEDWNCTFLIFDSRKTVNHPNCYLFQCPTNDACPTKPSAGVTSHRLMRDRALPGSSHSRAKDSKPTYVDGNKKNELFLDLNHPEPINQAEPLATGSSMNKSITSKILVLAEDIVNHLDKIDLSLQEEKGQEEEEKNDSKPLSYQKPGIIFQLPTTGAAANIMTTTQATTSTTTTTLTLTTTTTTLQMTTTTLPTTTTTTIPTTTLRATTPRPPPKPKTTPKPTTTTTSLPSTTTTRLPTTTTLPTTTSTVATTLPITTSKITSLPTTTSTTLTTTTSTTTRLTTTSTTTTEPPLTLALTTTPVKTTKHPFVKLQPANSYLSQTTSSKVIRLTSSAESRVPSPEERPQAPLPKTRNSTAEGASKINVSSPITPSVGVNSVTSSQNFNHGLNGFEKKIVKDLPNPDSKTGDRSGLLAALIFGVVFFAVVVFLITRRALEAMRRRHYSRLDYLINGMYIDS